MPFIGNKPSAVPLTSADIADGIITSAKIVDATIANADIANSTIALAKLSATGTADATTFLRGDNSWGSAGATAGQVIQVLSATDNTRRTTTSSSYVTASNTLSVTITPSSASNKIFVISQVVGGGDGYGVHTIQRTIGATTTNLGNATDGITLHGGSEPLSGCLTCLDSPSTTSATTYQHYFKNKDGTSSISLGRADAYTPTLRITCFEIKG